MSRRLATTAAQPGPVHRADSRESVAECLVGPMRRAAPARADMAAWIDP